MTSPPPLEDSTPELFELEPGALAERLGGQGRASAVYAALRRGVDPFAPGVLAPRALARLRSVARRTPVRPCTVELSSDGTRKMLLELEDGEKVECVLIPERSRTTLCISSQVGCARGCIFCLTASMGLARNLTAAEMVAEVWIGVRTALAEQMPPLRNLVFMGMGEPLDNADAVADALSVITGSGRGLGFGPGHVTVSTVGPTPRGIREAARLPARIAWSLHAADDALRRRLVPTQRHGVEVLLAAFRELARVRGMPLFVEITLIADLNDDVKHAEQIADLFVDFEQEVRFNLLPMNPVQAASRAVLVPSPPERVTAFAGVLRDAGHFTKVRRARGLDARAACGQLAVLGTPRKLACT
jgi:23S rRNA (adenine2503-C2)-methyltransferase